MSSATLLDVHRAASASDESRPEMKDSGSPFIRTIPVHWSSRRLKFVLREPLKYGANEAGDSDDPNQPRFIRITDIADDGTLREDTFRSLPDEIARPYLLGDGDLLLARSGATVGKSFFYRPSWGEAAYAGYLIRARLELSETNPRFLHFFTQSDPYWQWVRCSFIQATIQNISAEKYANLIIPVPPLDEQRAIAAFLDRETATIDELIAKKRRLIEAIDQHRMSVISKVATRGLLPTRSLKHSGVDWLGDIPETWQALPLKRICEIEYGMVLELDRTLSTGTPILSLPNVTKDGRLVLDDLCLVELTDTDRRTYLLRKGDLLFNWRNGSPDHVGKTAYFAEDGDFAHVSFLLRLRFDLRRQEPRFFQHVLNNLRNTGFFGASKTQVNKTYNQTELRQLRVMVPPVEEQRQIARFVDELFCKNDELLTRTQQAIDQLSEYRSALISAAVTGQIDVRNYRPEAPV